MNPYFNEYLELGEVPSKEPLLENFKKIQREVFLSMLRDMFELDCIRFRIMGNNKSATVCIFWREGDEEAEENVVNVVNLIPQKWNEKWEEELNRRLSYLESK